MAIEHGLAVVITCKYATNRTFKHFIFENVSDEKEAALYSSPKSTISEINKEMTMSLLNV